MLQPIDYWSTAATQATQPHRQWQIAAGMFPICGAVMGVIGVLTHLSYRQCPAFEWMTWMTAGTSLLVCLAGIVFAAFALAYQKSGLFAGLFSLLACAVIPVIEWMCMIR